MTHPEKKSAPEAGGAERAGAPPPSRVGPMVRRAGGLLLVLTVLAIVIPNYRAAVRRSGPRACPANMKTIQGALEMWLLDHGAENLSRIAADPAPLLVEGGYLQVWPRCPGDTEQSYVLRSRGPGRAPEVACRRHGSMAEWLGNRRKASDLL